MSNYTIISFATIDGKYDRFAYHFEENMKDLNIPYDLEYIEPVQKSKTKINKGFYKRFLGRQRQKKIKLELKEVFFKGN